MPSRWDHDGRFPPKTRALRAEGGIKAHSRRGGFASNWWAKRWIQAMERLVDPGRLTRGRSYARRGQVLSIEETRDGIAARVQGSRPKPYKININVKHLSDAQWEQVIDALAEQALFTAQLLAGEMPRDIENAFNAAQVSLFPEHSGDMQTECSCPDYANPCKHLAATHYILGERFDEDPWLLFRPRGRTQEQILQALRQRRAGQDLLDDEIEEEDETESVRPLVECLAKFWEPAEPLEQFSSAIRPPAVPVPLLQRLGDPAFIPDPGLQTLLAPAYHTITRAALDLAFSVAPEAEENGSER